MTSEAWIVDAVRTPVGKAPRGALAAVRPDDLLVHCLKGLLARQPAVEPERIEDVIVGCAMPEAEQGMNVARMAAQLAGLPDAVPGMTVNRFCASGLEAIAIAADRIRLGQADLMIAGGTESMSLVPMMGHQPRFNPALFSEDALPGLAMGMGATAEAVARQYAIDREAQDGWALWSHQRAIAAWDQGAFGNEVLPFEVTRAQPGADSELSLSSSLFEHDEGPRREGSADALAGLRPVFSAQGSVTAGNSSQMSDGASALLLASDSMVKSLGLAPLGRFVGYAVRGVPARTMGMGPVEALPAVLARAGVSQSELAHIELNEAFAAQTVAVINELGLDPVRVNPLGGAIALGHPLGASGAIRVTTMIHALASADGGYGAATLCVGSGMGVAGLFEAAAA